MLGIENSLGAANPLPARSFIVNHGVSRITGIEKLRDVSSAETPL
jgi:hypothetical protein